MISKNQIKFIQSLHLKKNREAERLFIIEGLKVVNEFLNQFDFEIIDVYATIEFINNNSHLLKTSTVNFNEITVEELQKISTQQNPNQVLAIVKQKQFTISQNALNTETTLFLDDIRDPGNLGTIIRIADWFGIKQIICSPTSTELYNPKTLQASMGAVLRVSVIYKTFNETNTLLSNIPIYGTVLNGKNIYTTPLKKGIIVIGNEANGISTDILKHITNPITIPAANNNGSESLNAANACAIVCSEFFRQLH